MSEDLPLLLFVAVITFVVSSLLSATPELALLSVLVTTLLADVIKNRAWGRRTLLGLTGATIAGWLGRKRLLPGANGAASAPSAGAMFLTAGLASVITVTAVTGIEYVRDDALLVDRPTTFLSADPPPPADAPAQAGFSTAVDAITAYAERERWADEKGWRYAATAARSRRVARRRRSAPRRGRGPMLQVSRRASARFFIAPAFSDVHHLVLALERSDGRWRVDREMTAGDLALACPADEPHGQRPQRLGQLGRLVQLEVDAQHRHAHRQPLEVVVAAAVLAGVLVERLDRPPAGRQRTVPAGAWRVSAPRSGSAAPRSAAARTPPRPRRAAARREAYAEPAGSVMRSTRKVRQSSRPRSQQTRYQRRPRFTSACGSTSRRPNSPSRAV